MRRGQERPGPRGGKYPSFTLLSFEFQSRVLVLSILYYIYIQGNPAHIRKRAGECVKCFLKAFRTSRSRSWNKTESHIETVKFRSEELSIYVRSSQQGHLRITIITIIHRGVSVSTCLTVSYHVGNELEHLIHFVSDYTILQDVFPDNAAKRKILSLVIRSVQIMVARGREICATKR